MLFSLRLRFLPGLVVNANDICPGVSEDAWGEVQSALFSEGKAI